MNLVDAKHIAYKNIQVCNGCDNKYTIQLMRVQHTKYKSFWAIVPIINQQIINHYVAKIEHICMTEAAGQM